MEFVAANLLVVLLLFVVGMQLLLVVEIALQLGPILCKQSVALGLAGLARRDRFLDRGDALIESVDQGRELLFGHAWRTALGILALVEGFRDAVTDHAEQGKILFEQ